MARTSVDSPASDLVSVGQALLERVGRTPLLRLARLERETPGVRLAAKAEWFNPGGSVKDRAAASIIDDAQARGLIRPGKILLDATSGNTGIAYAMIAAAKGYQVRLCVPANANPQVLGLLRAYGAEVTETDPLQGSDGAILYARRLAASEPDRFVYLDQYNNPANWQAHYCATAPEIWEQTRGSITHFVAGLGTTGTFTGTARRLKELNPDLQAIAVQPDSGFHGLEGLKHLESAIVPGIYDPALPDETIFMPTEEAYRSARRLAKEEGVLAGPSSGASLAVGLRLADELAQDGRGGLIVMIFPDSGARYAAEGFFSDHKQARIRTPR
ncbi:MAG: cysteine synthase family protein [Candidatus Omnitrophica bacterium]|nr:cysteine synthase family protein [Candidatus Omnitrophota bacterium]